MSTAPLQQALIFDRTGGAKERLLSRRGEPLFYANWDNVLFIHYELEADELQRCIPYPLDLYHGRAFVSLVAFTMRGMRPRLAGKLGAALFKPIATHHFLNVRTYVIHKGETGIYFMREWLSNRLAAWLGPRSFGLPYHLGKIEYQSDSEHEDEYRGRVEAVDGSFRFCATLTNEVGSCGPESLDEFLLERYTAFTQSGNPPPILSHLARTMAASCGESRDRDRRFNSRHWIVVARGGLRRSEFFPGRACLDGLAAQDSPYP